MADNPNQTGNKIKRARELRGMTQKELGQHLGMSSNNVYLIETGRSDINMEKLQNVARILNVPIAQLLPGDDVLFNVMDADHHILSMILAATPSLSGGDHIGLLIPDESMYPAYRIGDIVSGAKRPIAECNGLDCIVEIDGKLNTRRVLCSATGEVTLVAYNPTFPPLANLRLEWAAPVNRVERPRAPAASERSK